MRPKLLFILATIVYCSVTTAQNVGIGTVTPLTKLEIKNPVKSTVRISSNGFGDTSQLTLSNRNASNQGTDFTFSANAETSLRLTTASDIAGNNHDSILTVTPAGRIGVNKVTASERLDVRGNINITDGSIKVNGVDGSAGQVLMKNAGGTFGWGSVANSSQYPNVIGFRAGSSVLSPTPHNWTIPAGVTKIFVEAWGGGGGGAIGGGGGGGAYAATEWTVTPGASVTISLGEAGEAAPSAITDGENGGNTTVTIGGVVLQAYGGSGGSVAGGGFPGRFSTNAGLPVFGQSGAPGETTKEVYGQYSSTIFYTAANYGAGGQSGNTTVANNNGGFRSINTATSGLIKQVYAQVGTEPGGGGGGDMVGGRYGGPGMVIIHY
jgi:hypothetical protein